MPIEANVSGGSPITASVGETQIDVSVSGGFGPSGAAGSQGPQGIQGIQGPAGPAGGNYTLPTATASVLGGVKIGSGISIDGNGVISASSGYTLPSATTSTLGGVIVGAGLSVSSGTVSANLTSVAGRTGAVTLSKSDVGLGNLDNTSDAAKPISTATQTALDGKAASSHTHAASDITSGTIATARLGSGAASASNFLRGDGTWATAGSSSASDLTSGTLANSRLTSRARAAVNVFNWSSFR